MSSRVDRSRRALLRGRISQSGPPLRPPWAVAEDAFLDGCVRCGACIEACPEGIIASGEGGFPEVDFHRGGCTFCCACVDACPEPLFGDPESRPGWFHEAEIQPHCLAREGVFCQSCRDACEWDAIRFSPAASRIPIPDIDPERCTGCGFCVSVCPVDAVTFATGYSQEPGR